MHRRYDSSSYIVSARIELPTLAEAEEEAEAWMETHPGGSVVIQRRWTKPWPGFERVATYGGSP